MALSQKVTQGIKTFFEYADWWMKTYGISPDAPKYSSTVTMLTNSDQSSSICMSVLSNFRRLKTLPDCTICTTSSVMYMHITGNKFVETFFFSKNIISTFATFLTFFWKICLNKGPKYHFSTCHVIPHSRALVPCLGLTSEVCVVGSTSVLLTPAEILNLYRVTPLKWDKL